MEFKTLLAQLTAICSVALCLLAHFWITGYGDGLNPFIALPIATVLLMVPHLWASRTPDRRRRYQ